MTLFHIPQLRDLCLPVLRESDFHFTPSAPPDRLEYDDDAEYARDCNKMRRMCAQLQGGEKLRSDKKIPFKMRGGGAGASTASRVDAPPLNPETLQWQNPEETFDKLDADGNGTLEKSELIKSIVGAGYAEEHAVAIFGELDKDKGGTITKQEWRERFYASSLVHAKHPADETFDDLHHGRPGCTIPKTEHRAMIVPQLRDLCSHIDRRCTKEGGSTFNRPCSPPRA